MIDEVDLILKIENNEIKTKASRDELVLNLINTILSKENKNINDYTFLFEEEDLKITKELKLEDINKESHEIKIEAISINKSHIKREENIIEKNIKNNVICPKCKRFILINIDDYKITLNKCDKGHYFPNIFLNKFYSTQNLDLKLLSKNDINSAPTPISASNPVLKKKEENEINNNINYYSSKCTLHFEKYSSYCVDCNQNLCSECEMNHNINRDSKSIHKIKHFYEILSNNDEHVTKLRKEMEKFRIKLDKLKIELDKLKNIINSVMNNYETYYKIYNDMISNYNIETRNYHILKNITNVNLDEVFKDLDKINNEGHCFKQFEYTFEIYNKMNCLNEFIIRYLPDNSKKIRLFGTKFVANNKNKCKIIFNNQINDIYDFYIINNDLKNYIKSKDGILEIKLRINKNENLTNMSHMFKDCTNLLFLPNISELNTFHVTDMSYLFYNCQLLENISDISKWNTSNVTNMSYMFFHCSSLTSLPEISNWNISNCSDLSHMFSNCISLLSFPDISNWNLSNMLNMSYLFYYCSSLKNLPDINKWNIKNVNNISYMFSCCSSLTKIPDISVWDTSQVRDVSYLFFGCKSLTELPDISKWNSSNISNMGFMFDGLNPKVKTPKLNPNECLII